MSSKNVDITFVYSSPSVEALENLINGMSETFGIPLTVDDMFYYGVFCKVGTYADYDMWEDADMVVDVPSELTSVCSTLAERTDFVKQTINQILRKEIVKPEWMKFIEEYASCLDEFAPSTFLYLIPKKEKYERFAKLLIDFLYSPNMLVTMLE